MDCRAFRRKHLAFVDDTLPGVEVVRMQLHLSECANCATWDHRVRRSLLLARNHLRPITPSDGFQARLAYRLEQERRRGAPPSLLAGGLRWTTAAAVVLSLAVIAGSAILLVNGSPQVELARLPTVVLEPSTEDFVPSDPFVSATPAFVATVSTGMAILPALMLAAEVPAAPGDGSGVTIRPVAGR